MTTLIFMILLMANLGTISSQGQTAPSTTIEMTEEENAFPSKWIYGMVISGFLGIILITSMCCHSIYNFHKHKLMTKPARALYILFFLSYLTTCIAYAFFRLDLILPMGTKISCTLGYYLTTNSVYLSKLILFMIFIMRIDLAFHSSALGYPRSILFCIAFTYFAITTTLNASWVFVTKDIVTFQSSSYFYGYVTGICTSGSDDSKYKGMYTLTLGLMFLGDMIANIVLCSLFIYKLRIVVKMVEEPKHHRKEELRRGSTAHKNDKLKKVMHKQTSLVLLACVSTMLILGSGAVLSGFSLMMPIDATVNAFCVWLMFTFSDPVWNKMVHACCCCCCVKKSDLLITLHSISNRLSVHTDHTHTETHDQISVSSNPASPPTESKNVAINFNHAKHMKKDSNGIEIQYNNTQSAKKENV